MVGWDGACLRGRKSDGARARTRIACDSTDKGNIKGE